MAPRCPGLLLRDLAVAHDAEGRPSVVCAKFPTVAAAVALSIAHSPTTATAVAVLLD